MFRDETLFIVYNEINVIYVDKMERKINHSTDIDDFFIYILSIKN